MYILFYFAVFIRVATFATSENNADSLDIVAIAKAIVRVDDNRRNQTDERRKREISDSDRDTILNTFNCQRSRLGASDMNYLSWSSSLENDINKYTQRCDFDAKFYASTENSYLLQRLVSTYVGQKSAVDYFFTTSTFANWVTSRYLVQISGDYKYCVTARANGITRYNVHFYVYGLSTTSQFNELVRQYTTGNACTRCQNGVNWCYSNLCRGDCSNTTSGCCPVTNDVPVQCESSSLVCGSSSSGAEVKASVMMLVIVTALRSYFL